MILVYAYCSTIILTDIDECYKNYALVHKYYNYVLYDLLSSAYGSLTPQWCGNKQSTKKWTVFLCELPMHKKLKTVENLPEAYKI